MLTVGSLFTGIGGIDLGLERAGMRIAWQCEIDPWCQRVLAKHWPDVTRYTDVRELGVDTPRVDVLAGGFPCQPVSLAGKRLGQDDERWLWPEFARLVRLLRPRYVLVENVPGLLARGMGDVLGDLAACGYDAEWDSIGAVDVGAPHRRRRVWIVAYPASGGWPRWSDGDGSGRPGGRGRPGLDADAGAAEWSEGGGQPANGSADGRAQPVADASGNGLEGRQPAGPAERPVGRSRDVPDAEGRAERAGLRESEPRIFGRRRLGDVVRSPDAWAVEPDVGRVAHGIPARVDRLRGLGNAVVPQVVEWIGRRMIEEAATA